MSRKDLTLLTDFYELTMMQGYYKEGQNETVVFDVFFRNNPSDSGYSICAGLAQVIEYIPNSGGEQTVSQQGLAPVFHKKILYCGCY